MKYTVKKIKSLIAATVPAGAASSLAFLSGDHWQKGKAWIGPRPFNADMSARLVMKEIERAFISANVTAEITNRHSNAVIGRAPAWALVPAAGEEPGTEAPPESTLEQINGALLTWFQSDDKQVMEVLQNAINLALVAERAVLRLYLPPAMTAQGVAQAFPSLGQALDKIWLELLPMGSAAYLRDPETMERSSNYVYSNADGKPWLERQTLVEGAIAPVDEETDQPIIEEAQPSGRMLTLIEILEDGTRGDMTTIAESTLDTGGRLLTFELRLPALITDPIKQMQKALNVDLTMMVHNILGTGFLERTIFNAQMPGEWIDDPTIESGRRFVPKPYNVGMGVTNNLVGVPIKDLDTGNTSGYATPSIVYREPTGIGMFTDAQKAIRASMLHEAQQDHALIIGDATPSGVARIQALGDFLISLSLTITRAQAMIRWLLETTAALAFYLCDRAQEFDQIQADVTMKITMPPMSPEDMKAIAEIVDAGFISHETGLEMVPQIEDPDAEKARIAIEQSEKQAAQVTTLAAAVRANQTAFDQGLQQS